MPVLFGLINGKEFRLETGIDGALKIDGEEKAVELRAIGRNRYSVLVDGYSVSITLSGSGDNRTCLVNGKHATVAVESERTRLLKALAKSGTDEGKPLDIRAPMPALVSSIPVQVGDSVTAGQTVVVLEAMKMENEVRTNNDGVIASILVKKGESVEKGALLIRIETPKKSE